MTWKCKNCGHQMVAPEKYNPEADKVAVFRGYKCRCHKCKSEDLEYISKIDTTLKTPSVVAVESRKHRRYERPPRWTPPKPRKLVDYDD